MMSVFGWSNTATVKVSSVTQVIVGILSLCIFAGFATGKLLKMYVIFVFFDKILS